MAENAEKKNPHARKYEIGQLFTPATPINERDLFAGRSKQIQDVIATLSQRGRHAVVYGERGVGKTSLANVLSSFTGSITNRVLLAPREECHTADTFASVWLRVFKKIKVSPDKPIGFASMTLPTPIPWHGVGGNDLTMADLYETATLTPDIVRDALTKAAEHYAPIIIIDEFDRLSDPADTQLFADTIKTLSDFSVRATIVLVGVADAVDDLIGGHESIQRNLEQIPMPRMSEQELRQIVTDRLPRVGMSIEEDALKKICILSRGLPHYTHFIGQYSAWATVDADSDQITAPLVADAVKTAINKTQQTVQSAYHKATMSPRKDNLFEEVLLACALAKCDEYGYFAAADVRGPLSEIMAEDYGISRFIGHLGKFCEESRGQILQEIGERYQRRFRFKNPLMQPYIVMRGVAAKKITLDQLRDYPQVP